jgi:hypothetical protein
MKMYTWTASIATRILNLNMRSRRMISFHDLMKKLPVTTGEGVTDPV